MDRSFDKTIVNAQTFARILEQERKRTDRSGHPFVLMLMTFSRSPKSGRRWRQARVKNIRQSLRHCVRQTDVIGWYKPDAVIGIIYTEVAQEPLLISRLLKEKVWLSLQGHLTPEQLDSLSLTAIVYPPEKPTAVGVSETDKLYPEYKRIAPSHIMKRLMDIVGSVVFLGLLSPLLIAIAIVIKLTSPGPVLFRQPRVGQYGRLFTLLKFRSMYNEADSHVHEQYVKQFILHRRNGSSDAEALKHNGLYKLSHDDRITPVGRVLRSLSLDELPQFFNVLTGSMSLVGPRPPLPYEVDHYDTWHLRRVLEVKPGITGPWQVKGRSQTTFEEMVRLDLQYIDHKSMLTDFSLLLQTPWVVIKGVGAR